MKKIIVMLVTMLFVSSLMAQTFRSVKAENRAEQKLLNEKLETVKDRLFYLTVTLKSIPASTNEKENEKIKKDKHFADKEIADLEAKQKKLETLIDELEESSLEIERLRIKKGSPKNFPEEMGPIEYKRRNRTQAYNTLENAGAIMNSKNELKGLLINNKIGLSQNAIFYFVRTDIKEVPRPGIIVDPKSEKAIFLPMGTYHCTVVCGHEKKQGMVSVDPRTSTEAGANSEPVHFWVIQNL